VHCIVQFPARWIDSAQFEKALAKSGGPHDNTFYGATFKFPTGCKVMVDAAVKILSLANQLAHTTRDVTVDFEEGELGTMGYLNRVGFFDHLDSRIYVLPSKPEFSTAALHRGGSGTLVEIAEINRNHRDENLPTRLSDALMASCAMRNDCDELGGAAWTIFAELIDNIFSHSDTPLDGFAALQVYQGGNNLEVAVSDSGLGIMGTIRPTLGSEYPNLLELSDIDLLVEMFRQGLSRHGDDRGCGLRGSAAKAMKFKATLDVRLPAQRVLLTPSEGIYTPNIAHCYDGLPLLWGTHIAFTFKLKT